MGTLNSPSSRIVKDSTPSRRRILRYYKFRDWWILTYFIFGHGESSLNNFWSMVNLERTCVLLFYYFLCLKANLDLEKTNQLGESSPNFIFAVVNLDLIILEKRWIDGESWPNDFVEKVNRGEDLRWVGSRSLWHFKHPKIFCNSFEVIKGSQSGQRSNFQKCSDFAEIYDNDPYDILSILKLFKAAGRYFSQILWIKKSTQSHLGSQGSSHNFGTILAYQIEHGQLLDGRRH